MTPPSLSQVLHKKTMLPLIVILLLAAIILAALYIVYRIAFYPVPLKGDTTLSALDNPQFRAQKDRIHRMITDMAALPYEEVSIIARDGVRLTGRYYHSREGAPLDIGFHGYRGSIDRDFCGGAQISLSLGHNVLLVNERSQNGSEGRCITFGILERLDCLDWLAYANRRFDTPPITLYGVSMGAATVLMATELGLGDNVRGIIADSPYSAPLDIICQVGKANMGLPPALTAVLATAAARIYGKFPLRAAAAAEAVKKATVPILIIHGENDHFVPCGMSDIIARNCTSPLQLETFPDAEHGLSFLADTPRYERAVREFMTSLQS